MNLQTALTEFLLSTEADGLSRNTTVWYQSLLTRFVTAHAGRALADITAHDVRLYLQALRQHYSSADTICDHARALHRFWRWCSAEYELKNPMRNISYPKMPAQKAPKAASLDDVLLMFHAAANGRDIERNQAILAFALDTGARSQGIRELTVQALDMERRTAVVTEKGNKTRALPFTKVTAALLLRWLEVRQDVPTLFYSTDTLEPLTASGLYQLFRRLARRAGVQGRFNPHSFRHALTLAYIKAGGDAVTLARILGHESVDTLARYYAVFTSEEIAAAHEKYSPARRLEE